MRVTNGIPLKCPLLLLIGAVNRFQTLKAELLREVSLVDPEMRVRFTSPHPKVGKTRVTSVVVSARGATEGAMLTKCTTNHELCRTPLNGLKVRC
jgi:hypothetical protein